MSIKWFSLTISAMAFFFLMFVVSSAMAQDGYRVYQGPTDSQSYHKGAMKKSYKKAARPARVTSAKNARRSTAVTVDGDSLYDRPEYPSYVNRRFAENPMGYSGFVSESGTPMGRMSSTERMISNTGGFETTHIGHRRAIMPHQDGGNAEFLASVIPGYMKTRQMDVIGKDLYVWESGVDVPKRYKVEYQPNERITIRDMHGNRAGGGVIDGRTGGIKGTLNLLESAETVPLRINRYLTNNTTWDYSGRNK